MRKGAHGWYTRDLELNRERHRAKRAALPTCCVRDCSVRSERLGLVPLRGKFYCRRHAALYTVHYAILDCIRNL